mgnify:CR=1 FL=1
MSVVRSKHCADSRGKKHGQCLADVANEVHLVGFHVVPKPAAPGERTPELTAQLKHNADQVQEALFANTESLHATKITDNVVQARVPRNNAHALANALDEHHLTLRATFMPPAVDSSPVCAEVTTDALRQALANNGGAVNVPHPLGLGSFDVQCDRTGITMLQYSI